MPYHVLFVDDDAFMLKALLRIARRLRPNWSFAGCEQPAQWQLGLQHAGHADMIICDYQMPQFNGEQILRQVRETVPAAVRVLLTGDTSEEIVSRASQFSHHILGKPFSEQSLNSLFAVVERLHRLPFTQRSRVQLGQTQGLPVLPEVVNHLRQLLRSQVPDLHAAAQLLLHEPVLAAKLLQLANSAFMGFAQPASNLHDAVIRLGARMVEAVATLHCIDQHFASSIDPLRHQHISQWAYDHAVDARKLARYAHMSASEQDLVFSAAIFSAIGRLVELGSAPSDAQTTLNAVDAQFQSGFNNATLLSVYLLTLWGHEETLCDVMLWQDVPSPEHNAVEKLSFVLFLTKQYRLHTSAEGRQKLLSIIESDVLATAFQQLLAEAGCGH